MRSFCLMLLALSTWSARAQTIETIETAARINNGLVVASDGSVYASDLFGTGFNGNAVSRIDPSGAEERIGGTFNRPAGLALDAAGSLYVANFGGGTISRVTAAGIDVIATGLLQPAEVLVDPNGDLIVAEFGGFRISRISGGVRTVIASGQQMASPVGLTFDDQGRLYSSHLDTGRIYRMDPGGGVTLIATIPQTPIGFLAYARGDLYVTATGNHRIYRVTLGGEVSEFAGTGQSGSADGPVQTAGLTSPDGIAATASGDTLYFSENSSNRLRRIVLAPATGLGNSTSPRTPQHELGQNYPNPFGAATVIPVTVGAQSELEVVDVLGRVVYSALVAPGPQTVPFDASTLPVGTYFYRLRDRPGARQLSVVR